MRFNNGSHLRLYLWGALVDLLLWLAEDGFLEGAGCSTTLTPPPDPPPSLEWPGVEDMRLKDCVDSVLGASSGFSRARAPGKVR